MASIIRGARLVSPREISTVDIVISDGRVAALMEPGTAALAIAGDVYDADGLLAFPGFIDPHVHSRDPGETHKEDFWHVTRAAAVGGITTVLDMPNTIPPVDDAEVLVDRVAHHARTAHVDFGLWCTVLDAPSIENLQALREAGAIACKLFWGYGFDRETKALVYQAAVDDPNIIQPLSTRAVYRLFAEGAAIGMLIGLHCEDVGVLAGASDAVGVVRDYSDLVRVRPVAAEAVAVAMACELAAELGTRIHVLHTSSDRSARIIRSAAAKGTMVTAETCPHYLTLTADDYPLVGGALKVFPPVRDEANLNKLWERVNDETIQSIASDHAPHDLNDRSLPFGDQPAGIIGIETMARVLVDAALNDRMSLERLAWVLSEGTARLYGLYPRKGALLPGSDADITLVDPESEWTIANEDLHTKTKRSPWNGRAGRGAPVRTILRGQLIASDGEPVGEPTGCFVRSR